MGCPATVDNKGCLPWADFLVFSLSMTHFTLPEDFDLGEHFDHRTLTKAIEMQPQRAVLSMEVRGPKLVTRMQGPGSNTYAQSTELVMDRRLGLRLQGQCTCPVGINCHHVAAALMAFEAKQIRLQKGLPDTMPQVTATVEPVHMGPAQPVMNLGTLPLQPVLRLGTCVDVASEALLHQRYGSAVSRNTTLKQASAQLLLRYRPDAGAPVDFHFPSGPATTALVEVADPARPGRRMPVHFQRQSLAEAAALRTLFTECEFRPWSLSAGLAMSRLTRLNTGRAPVSAMAVASASTLEGTPLVLVPQRRDQWPELLAKRLPELESRGWLVEVSREFPFEMHSPDAWAVQVDEEPGADWFSVGLKVTVEGQPVDLVPLLVSLVQTGWLKLDASLREGDGGEVLVPWPSNEPVLAGAMPRQRLLRLPVQRIAPLMDWLRVVFKAGDKSGVLRMSRFDLNALE